MEYGSTIDRGSTRVFEFVKYGSPSALAQSTRSTFFTDIFNDSYTNARQNCVNLLYSRDIMTHDSFIFK